MADGLRRGERVFCAQRPEILKRLVHDLIFLGLNPDHERERGALRNEEWTAEVVADKVTPEPRYSYVVHHCQPFEIAGRSVSADFDSASASIGKPAVQS